MRGSGGYAGRSKQSAPRDSKPLAGRPASSTEFDFGRVEPDVGFQCVLQDADKAGYGGRIALCLPQLWLRLIFQRRTHALRTDQFDSSRRKRPRKLTQR